MTAISAVSKLSWRAIREDYSLERYEEELENIRSRKRNYTSWQVAVGAGFACGGFCIQFGCDWPAFLYASIAAILGFRLRAVLNELGSNHYMNIAVAAFVSTLLAWASAFISTLDLPAPLHTLFHSDTPWHPLMACALFIVPGVPLINFVSDMLDSYVQIGITRAVNTLLIVVAMAFGIALAVHVCGIDNFVKDLSMTPHHTYLEFAVAAAISAVGFSMIFNIPRRLLWVVAVGGIIAVCTRNFVNLGPSNHNIGLDWGPVIGSLVGSALISIIVTRAVHWFHTPHHCLSIPSVIPMIPGVLVYRALFAFIDMSGVVGEVTIAMNNAIQASLIILCIAVGVAIPNIFAAPLDRSETSETIETTDRGAQAARQIRRSDLYRLTLSRIPVDRRASAPISSAERARLRPGPALAPIRIRSPARIFGNASARSLRFGEATTKNKLRLHGRVFILVKNGGGPKILWQPFRTYRPNLNGNKNRT